MKPAARQRGAALLIMVTVVVVGFAWFVAGALGKAGVTQAERDAKTALALQAAKKALLGHVAHYAARTNFDFPGRMPCPESLSAYGTANEGQSPGACSNTTAEVGRLPWRTLGIDQLRDGDGELLWYVLSPNFHPTTLPSSPPLNFGTPPALPFDGANVVALIIAPGRALRSNPCSAVNQQANRYATPLDPAKFFECGNATGNYTNPGSNTGSNDRVLAITASEWSEAIAGAVADRLQRQVAPALDEFRTTESNANWGRRFLPNPSSFTNPASNDLCGADGVREGLTPATLSASSSCTSWTSGTVTQLGGLLGLTGCNQVAGVGYQCWFINLSSLLLLEVRIRAIAPRLGGAFRGRISAADITNNRGGTVSTFSLNTDFKSYQGELDFRISFPLLSALSIVTVTIPNLPDAAVMSDPRAAWFFGNEWGRHTYMAIGRGNRFNGGGDCSGPGDNDCLTLLSLPSVHGNTDDKQFVVALMGPALPAVPQAQPSNNVANYLESRTGNSPDEFQWGRLSSTYNDRYAACPFRHVDPNGLPLASIC